VLRSRFARFEFFSRRPNPEAKYHANPLWPRVNLIAFTQFSVSPTQPMHAHGVRRSENLQRNYDDKNSAGTTADVLGRTDEAKALRAR
jgi:hypothetical protein